jgi:CxxC-x17-CxxC domain-containing protein
MAQDKTLKCVDCGKEFTFTSGEQDFYAQKGFTNAPTRCPSCRAARKAAREEGTSYRSSGGYGEQRQMYPAVCAQCGKPTEVPFQPRGDKPVYCSDCYRSQKSSEGGYSSGRSGGGYGGGGRSRDRGRGRGRNDW